MAHFATLETIEAELPYLREHLSEMKDNISKNRHKLGIMENIPRLIEFYRAF